jgi:hypothetical protein
MSDQKTYIAGRVGPSFNADGAEIVRSRFAETGEQVIAQGHGPNYEQAGRGKVFWASSQAVVTFGAALTATGVTFHLANPVGSSVNLEILQTRITVLTVTAAGGIVYAWNAPSLTNVTAGTALTVNSLNGAPGIAQAKAATTLPAVPVAIAALASAVTAAGIFQITDYVDGAIVVAPGAVLSIQGITYTGTSLLSMYWAECPIAA